MSKLSRKAILAVLSLVLTFVALGATTFAWFSLGTTAVVNPFDVQVRGGDGLEIQFVGDTEKRWFATLNSEIMEEFLFTGTSPVYANGKLDAVTTPDGTSNFLKMTEIDIADGTVSTTEATANSEYLEFQLKFRTQRADAKLDISAFEFDSVVMNDWVPDIDYTNERGTPVVSGQAAWNIYPHHAARLSIEGTKTSVFQHTKADEGNMEFGLLQGAQHYVAKKWGLTTLNNSGVTVATASDTITNDHKDIATFVAGAENSDTEGYFETTVTVRIWIEGWDGNTYDAIFDKKFSVGFSFQLQE